MAGRDGVGWARVSKLSSGQDEKNQLPDIYGYAAGNEITIRRTWELKESAYGGDQEAHQREVIELARQNPGLVLISWAAVDRVERRGTRYALRFLLDLEDAGGEWHITGHGRVTVEDLPGLITLGLGAQKAHDESALKSDRVRINFNTRDGFTWPGGKTWTDPPGDRIGAFRGKVPFGYLVVTYPPGKGGFKWLVPHPAESSLVTGGYEHAAEGWTLERIAEWWSAELGLGPGHQKDDSAVWRVLKNTNLYALGMYSVRKRKKRPDGTSEVLGTFIHEVEALADAELARRALAAMSSRRGGGPRLRHPEREDYSSLLACGKCGKDKCYRKVGGRAGQYRRYACNTCCHSFSADKADAEIERIMSGDTARAYGNEWVAGLSSEAVRARIELEIAQIGQRGLAVDRMIAELQRLQGMRESIPEDTPGRWVTKDLGKTHGDLWREAAGHRARLDMCRELWEWTGKRGPARGSAVIERKVKDGRISPRKLEGMFREVQEGDPEFLSA